MRNALLYLLAVWLCVLFVDGSVAFRIFTPRFWRKTLWVARREWKRISRRHQWRQAIAKRKKTSAVPRGISPG